MGQQQTADDHDAGGAAPVWGLVLAGGASRRMGEDKGSLDYHGVPQALWMWRQLDAICDRAYVSVNLEQQSCDLYTDLPTITDEIAPIGPATGLMSAWSAFPRVAWLVVAVDLPFLDRGTLMFLLEGRGSSALATAFVHPDGTLEPLCAIWEAVAQPALDLRLQKGDASLRRCLEAGQTEILTPPASQALRSANSPAEYQDARRRFEGEEA